MAYADYQFYTGEYVGKDISSAEFDHFMAAAGAYLDAVTFGKAAENAANRQVKLAACAVADAYRINEQGGGAVTERLGEWSVDYARGVSKTKNESQRLQEAAKLYLAGSGLLCRWALC